MMWLQRLGLALTFLSGMLVAPFDATDSFSAETLAAEREEEQWCDLKNESHEICEEVYKFVFRIVSGQSDYCMIYLEQIFPAKTYKKVLVREFEPELEKNLLGMRFSYYDQEVSVVPITLEIAKVKVEAKGHCDSVIRGEILCEPLGFVSIPKEALAKIPSCSIPTQEVGSWVGPEQQQAIIQGLKQCRHVSGRLLKATLYFTKKGLKSARDLALAALESTKD